MLPGRGRIWNPSPRCWPGGRRIGVTSVTLRSGTLSLSGVTAGPVQAARIRKETGGVLGGREGRVTVRNPDLGPLELAEATLRALDLKG